MRPGVRRVFTLEPYLFSRYNTLYIFNPSLSKDLATFLMLCCKIPEYTTGIIAVIVGLVLSYSVPVALISLIIGLLIPTFLRMKIIRWRGRGVALLQRARNTESGFFYSSSYPKEFYLILEKARQICADGEMTNIQVNRLHRALWSYNKTRELSPLSDSARQVFYEILDSDYITAGTEPRTEPLPKARQVSAIKST